MRTDAGFGLSAQQQQEESMGRLLRHRSLAIIAAVAVSCGGVAACSSSSGTGTGTGGNSSSSSSSTLTMESSPETTITQAFNPYLATQAAYGMGATGLIYEPLVQFDLAKPTVQYPWLATSYAWADGGKQITFTIRQGVKWNNGTPLTAADVAYTFDLVKANASINLGGLTISSVSTSGNTVTFANPNPVGTGPYMLGTFTPQGFTLKKNPYYWQPSKVKVSKVYFPVYTSNTGALNALFSGQITWTGNYIPGLKTEFVDKAPAS